MLRAVFACGLIGAAWLAASSDALDALKDPPPEAPPPAASAADATAVGKTPDQSRVAARTEPVSVYVVPINEAISKANEYILRRAIKQAIEERIDVLLIDMDTPGGRLDVTLKMMEMLDRFEGETITFVNPEAISAGAYIAMVTNAIYFAPRGIMGAAAVVASGGQEIDESMKAKIDSYLQARMRSYTELHPYRAEIIKAMSDLDYELEIDGKVLKKAGELLSLTASEAVASYGRPARPLLAEGIAASVDELLAERYGAGNVTVRAFRISWSEDAAKYIDAISPVLLGLGLLLLFIEFKTPGFGLIGLAGICLIMVVFLGNYLAGLAGQEAIVFFLLGLALIAVEIFLLPGTFIFLILGVFLVIGALFWSMTDVWPVWPAPGEESGGFAIDPGSAWSALYQVVFALVFAVSGIVLLWRYLPQSVLFRRLVVSDVSPSPDPVSAGGGSSAAGQKSLPEVGARGVVTRQLHPLGEVEIDGHRYEATVAVGFLAIGTPVRVIGRRQFSLLVEEMANG
jgi:membrane-bound serine protease (ClpP class)